MSRAMLPVWNMRHWVRKQNEFVGSTFDGHEKPGEFGQGKLIALVAAGVVAVGIVLAAGLYVNKPSYETLYVGLESSDLNQVSVALAEANMDFEVGADGSSLQVPVGMTGKSRLYLAERGLPNSANAGYELFDNVGSLGLTSFMQEVTRVRALEGEIARTIQQISGIAAARVHIVMADRGSFRKTEQKPTASVDDPCERQYRPQRWQHRSAIWWLRPFRG